MIFPWLNGIYSITRAPITWLLFFANLAVFAFTFRQSEEMQTQLEGFMYNKNFSRIQGRIFADFVQNHTSQYPANVRTLASLVQNVNDEDRQSILGGMAMRDTYFLNEASHLESTKDAVAFKWWRKKFEEIQNIRKIHPSYTLGVTMSDNDLVQWITYQFTHSGIAHFAGNMLFLLIFSSSLEMVIGGLGVLVVYLLSGIVAALSFSLLNDASAVPLIGASGAISGLMALFSVLLWNRGVKYFFFLFIPKRGYTGWIYLPAWITFLLWALSDLAGHWSTPTSLGGVAYSAHIGGEVCGALIGLLLLIVRRARGLPLLPKDLPFETRTNFTQYV